MLLSSHTPSATCTPLPSFLQATPTSPVPSFQPHLHLLQSSQTPVDGRLQQRGKCSVLQTRAACGAESASPRGPQSSGCSGGYSPASVSSAKQPSQRRPSSTGARQAECTSAPLPPRFCEQLLQQGRTADQSGRWHGSSPNGWRLSLFLTATAAAARARPARQASLRAGCICT